MQMRKTLSEFGDSGYHGGLSRQLMIWRDSEWKNDNLCCSESKRGRLANKHRQHREVESQEPQENFPSTIIALILYPWRL